MAKQDNSDFSFGAVFGGLLGVALATLLWTLPLQGSPNWISEYQTLVTGIFALASAAASVLFLNHQMRQAALFESIRADREHRSARPLLAFVLVKLLAYSESCFRELRRLETEVVNSGKNKFDLPVVLDVPNLPDDTFNSLQLNLKFGSESAISVISKLLTKLQIQNSRYRSLIKPDEDMLSESLKNLHVYMVDALEISTLCYRLFPYARGELDQVEMQIKSGNLFEAGGLITAYESQEPFVMYLLNHYRDN